MPDCMSNLPSSLGTLGNLFSKFLGLRLREPNSLDLALSSSPSSATPAKFVARSLVTRPESSCRRGALVRSICSNWADVTKLYQRLVRTLEDKDHTLYCFISLMICMARLLGFSVFFLIFLVVLVCV